MRITIDFSYSSDGIYDAYSPRFRGISAEDIPVGLEKVSSKLIVSLSERAKEILKAYREHEG